MICFLQIRLEGGLESRLQNKAQYSEVLESPWLPTHASQAKGQANAQGQEARFL